MSARNGADEGTWDILWTQDSWHAAYEALEQMLPDWANLHMADQKRPLQDQVAEVDVIIPCSRPLPAAVIKAAPQCKLIPNFASATFHIDLDAAREMGIPVTIARGLNSQSTAETALMLMLMSLNRVHEAFANFRAGVLGLPVCRELHGKTVGLVGSTGEVGSRVTRLLEAFDAKVIGINSKSTRQEFEHMLSTSDVISLHCALNDGTRGMLGAAEFELMKPGVHLVNTARGAIIDHDAVLDALQNRKLGGLALDVHWVEPADPEEPIYKHPAVLATPHFGVASRESYEAMAAVVADNIGRARRGGELLNRAV